MVWAVPNGRPGWAQGVRAEPVQLGERGAGGVLNGRHHDGVRWRVVRVRGSRRHRISGHAAAVRHRVHCGRQPEDRHHYVERSRHLQAVRYRSCVVFVQWAVQEERQRRPVVQVLLAGVRLVLPAAGRVAGTVGEHPHYPEPILR